MQLIWCAGSPTVPASSLIRAILAFDRAIERQVTVTRIEP
jgi:hypothetical protein